MKDKHINHCLTCKTQNCYNRHLKPKTKNCLEIDYKDETELTSSELSLISKANAATKKAFEQKISPNFATNWLVGFIEDFFGNKTTVGIACCLDTIEITRNIVEILEREGLKTTLATCKLGRLTIDNVDKDGKPYKHPGCNPIS